MGKKIINLVTRRHAKIKGKIMIKIMYIHKRYYECTCCKKSRAGRVVAMSIDGVGVLMTDEKVVISVVMIKPTDASFELNRRSAKQFQILFRANVVKVDRALA